MSDTSPCLRCGACCCSYRVSFYWAESTATAEGWVPVELTNSLNILSRCMKGTDVPQPRCVALQGEVGQAVSCSIYAQRPSPCHEVTPGDDFCRRARQHHGLPLEDCVPPKASSGGAR